MLTGLHLLLSYACTYECDHCFLYCSPRSTGTFTLEGIEAALQQAVDAGVSEIYVEGGEPFLYYPLMLETLRLAKAHRLRRGVVSNAYWAESERDAELWLRPLVDIGLDDLSLSNDSFHTDDPTKSPAAIARRVATRLGLPVGEICIDPPTVEPTSTTNTTGSVVGGDVLFRGRAADRLTTGLPQRQLACFDTCPHEELVSPSRLHLDALGNLHVCQGIVIGNIWQTPLSDIVASYDSSNHPIVGPIVRGGPAELALTHGVEGNAAYVDHCHACFVTRRNLLDRFPESLTPPQVYGVEPD